jgi:hypothetical protein
LVRNIPFDASNRIVDLQIEPTSYDAQNLRIEQNSSSLAQNYDENAKLNLKSRHFADKHFASLGSAGGNLLETQNMVEFKAHSPQQVAQVHRDL